MAITSYMNSVCLQTVVDMFGINPLKFNCLEPLCIEYDDHGCTDYWTQYFEHGNLISREELAMELYRAELEVAQFLGQFPFPTYVCDEHIEFESCYRNKNVLGVNLLDYTFQTTWQCIQDFGVFEDEILGEGIVTLVDQDGDGYTELATILFDYSAVTTAFNADELTLLFQDFDQYNNIICPILSIEDDTDAGTITFTVNSWNLVDPALYLPRKFTDYDALNACDADIYVTAVNVCTQVKTCQPDGWVYYSNIENCSGSGCDETAYPFCVRLVDKELGLFKLTPGTTDDDGCFIPGTHCYPGGKPNRIEVNYISACNDCYHTKKNISFCNLIERAIVYLAISRLPRTLCGCGCSSEHVEELKYDTSITYTGTNVKFNFPTKLRVNSPFGTKIGELEAYKILNTLVDNIC